MLDFLKRDLIYQNNVEFDEEVEFVSDIFKDNKLLNALKDIRVVGKGYYQNDLVLFTVSGKITGIMVVPCAISLVDVDYPFSADLAATYTFYKGDDSVIEVKGDKIDLLPEVFQSIIYEVPLKVVANDAKYLKGKNWEVISESDTQNKVIDPRLAKLKDYKFEDD